MLKLKNRPSLIALTLAGTPLLLQSFVDGPLEIHHARLYAVGRLSDGALIGEVTLESAFGHDTRQLR